MHKVLLVLLILTGCSAKIEQRIEKIPPSGLRIAVLPFVSVDEKGTLYERESSYFIDDLGVVGEKKNLSPEEVTRRKVQIELGKSSYQLISPAFIDLELPHRGFLNPDLTLNYDKLYKTSPKDLCTIVFDCDAVLYGYLEEWDQSYYGVESVNSVTISLSLKSGKTGKELYYAKVEDSESSGLSQGPTGYFSLAVEPIKALDSESIEALMSKNIKKILTPITKTAELPKTEEPAPLIFSSAHSSPGGRIDRNEGLKVLVYGTEDRTGWFSIERVARRVPLVEKNEGRYIGEFFPLDKEIFEDRAVTVHLKDKYGRTTSQEVSGPAVSLSFGGR